MAELDADIVIVGAGLAGAATAYHLARLASVRVIILEREALPGVHSSGRNAAIVRDRVEDAVLRPILVEGADHLSHGVSAPFERRGLMLLGLGDQDVRDYFPLAQGRGLWSPASGTVDVAALLRTYLVDQNVHCGTEVRGWQRMGESCCVHTDRGDLLCRLVVNAAGAWAGRLGDLPLTPMNRHLFVTTPMPSVDPSWPCVWDPKGGLYFRPESGGLLLSCCDEVAADPGDYTEDPAMLDQLAEKVATQQPGLGELAVRSRWVGQRTFAPDRRFVIGPDPRNHRVFHVAGLGGHGVTASFAVGRLAALLITGRTVDAARQLAPSRLVPAAEHPSSPGGRRAGV